MTNYETHFVPNNIFFQMYVPLITHTKLSHETCSSFLLYCQNIVCVLHRWLTLNPTTHLLMMMRRRKILSLKVEERLMTTLATVGWVNRKGGRGASSRKWCVRLSLPWTAVSAPLASSMNQKRWVWKRQRYVNPSSFTVTHKHRHCLLRGWKSELEFFLFSHFFGFCLYMALSLALSP